MFLSKGGRRWEFVGVIHQILGVRDPLRLDRVITANVPRLILWNAAQTTGPCRPSNAGSWDMKVANLFSHPQFVLSEN
jgi:hypothetical protein